MSKDSAVLNLGEIGEEGLNFQPSTSPKVSSSTTHNFESNVPDSALDIDRDVDDDQAKLLDDGSGQTKKRTSNFFSMDFYSQFFDVDTEDVVGRLLWSITPRPYATSNFVKSKIQPNPDLYGPFWVCVTLIFSVAISGNVASYLQAALTAEEDAVVGFRWHYDFHKVTLAATAVFGYAILVPAGIYAALWHQGSRSGTEGGAKSVSILELFCIYGYSLAVFIPVSVLWTIQNNTFQWSLVMFGAGISGSVLVLALWNNMIKDNVRKNFAFIMVAVVIALHLLLACGFMLYFFHVPSGAVAQHGTFNSTVIEKLPEKDEAVKDEKSDVDQKVPADVPRVTREPAKEKKLKKSDVSNSKVKKLGSDGVTRKVANKVAGQQKKESIQDPQGKGKSNVTGSEN